MPCVRGGGADSLFAGSGADQLIQQRLFLAGSRTQDAAQPLHMLPDARRTGENDPDRHSRNVNTFIQHLARHKHGIGSGAEQIEELLALARLRPVGDHRPAEAAPEVVSGRIVGGEDDDPLPGVAVHDLPDHADLRLPAARDAALFEKGAEHIAAARQPGAEPRGTGPTPI